MKTEERGRKEETKGAEMEGEREEEGEKNEAIKELRRQDSYHYR